MSSTLMTLVAAATGGVGYVFAEFVRWVGGRRPERVQTLKTALEALDLAIRDVRQLREDLDRAHVQMEEFRVEIRELRDALAEKESK